MNDRPHPLVDDELSAVRTRQRRLLAGLTDQLIERYRPPVLPAWDGQSPTVVERELRRLADTEMDDPGVKPILDRSAELIRLTSTAAFLKDRAGRADKGPTSGLDKTARMVDWAFEVARACQDESRALTIGPETGNQGVARLIPLLVWADELAEDGYTDSRLGSPA